ncbi:T9SS type A sorting domain-containing protein [Rubrivirga litoralis]|uniref:T9SS type A sorting domain-containing protein n=2 Tax=Rubrivirga TaxID=1434037 RepID=A0ABU3BPU0_9BACT|nr:T9SS type A sorting domain-containing protein [Rubrivirga sp. F394]MDT0631305.1 T9SS type A sorting domain-containing protein [Rubrivirga sp. F394]
MLALLALAAGPASAQYATGLAAPFGITQLADGRVVVTEAFGGQATIVTEETAGGALFPGSEALVTPTGIIQLPDGDVLIADFNEDNGRQPDQVVRISDGVATLFATGLSNPQGLTLLSNNDVLITEGGSGRISRISNGTRSVFADTTTAPLSAPNGIIQIADGRILVASTNAGNTTDPNGPDDKILAFDVDGNLLGTFATLSAPRGLTQLADGRIAVTADKSLVLYNPDGTVSNVITTSLINPFGVTQLPDGRILVADPNLSSTGTTGETGTIRAFPLPPPVSSEPAASAGVTIGDAFPNPSTGRATLELTVSDPQAVRVTVYDVLGREMAVAFDGAVRPGATARVALGGADLAPGTYVVRVSGEAFAESRRLTVAR